MRRLLNTLYITQPDAYLACEGENVLVRLEGETRFRMPMHNLEGIVCFGYAGASPGLMSLCCERGVGLSFLTEQGQFMGRISGSVSGNVLLRREQYRWADDEKIKLRLSKRYLLGKIMNSRAVLSRSMRDHPAAVPNEEGKQSTRRLMHIATHLEDACDISQLMGMEGDAAKVYFSHFNDMVLAKKSDFRFDVRNRRPPLDRFNALLSFAYTLLTHEVTSALESVGLDPQVGFLHGMRPGRPSLALDLMEELRPHFADRLVFTLINRHQVEPDGFVLKENGAVLMDDVTRKTVLTQWQMRKSEELIHPYLEEKLPLGLVPYAQALLLARHIRGDIDDYPPFIWK